ncbi:MAG: FAD-dependent oxidoreductase [Parahaliea sp.]
MISVIGSGVAGLCTATVLSEKGFTVEVIEADIPAASCLAGGMLAPFCEGESAPQTVVIKGQQALTWWAARVPVTRRGTLVLAPARDAQELDRFAAATQNHHWTEPGTLEADLAGRFARGLLFPDEGHMDPVIALATLRATLIKSGVSFHTGQPTGQIVDCRGWAARDQLSDLRPVRGEMLEVSAPDVELSRTIRLLHPRLACYIVPRGQGRYMIGATMVESASEDLITARAVVELLSAAYTVQPAFAEAQLIMTDTGLRPAFPDNIPAVRRQGDRIYVNGMYRHGFLMAPALASDVARILAQASISED